MTKLAKYWLDGVIEIRTRDPRMLGADKSTEFWQPQKMNDTLGICSSNSYLGNKVVLFRNLKMKIIAI